MGWTSRADSEPCCGDEPGAVRDNESVVRLIHSRIEEPNYEPFNRRELVATGAFTDACGDADGLSVSRCDELSEEAILNAAQALAEIRPGRVGRGGLIAHVQRIRNVRLPENPDQVCFVYDDPKIDDRHHAVIRVSSELPRPELDEVRLRLRSAFDRRVLPPDQSNLDPKEGKVVLEEGALVAMLPPAKK